MHCPPVGEAITCSTPVYVSVFTCGQPAGKQEPPGATNPARPRQQSQGVPFPSALGRKTQRPCLGVRWGGVGESRELVALPLGQQGELAVLVLS